MEIQGVGDKGLRGKYFLKEMEFQTVVSYGEGGGGGKRNELLMQEYGYFWSNSLHNHNKMLGRKKMLSQLINQILRQTKTFKTLLRSTKRLP